MSSLDKFVRANVKLVQFGQELADSIIAESTVYALEIHRDELKCIWASKKSLYEKCVDELSKETSDPKAEGKEDDSEEGNPDIDSINSRYHSSYETYVKIVSKISASIHDRTNTPTNTQVKHTSSNFHLAPCDTESFKGDYLSWPSFRDMFSAIYIQNSDLSKVQKLFHLRKKTEGEAFDIVQKCPLTNSGFDVAWRNLKERFENKRMLVHSQLRILFNLSPVTSESSEEIKHLQREINSCISSLKLYDIDISSWDAIFVFICSTRLPRTTLSLWEQSIQVKKDIPKWSDLNTFLSGRFQTLETVNEINKPGNNSKSSASTVIPKNQRTDTNYRKINSNHAQVNDSNPLCNLCHSKNILLGTAVVQIQFQGLTYFVRALIDSGSQGTFVSEKIFHRLKLPFRQIEAEISGLNGVTSAKSKKLVSFSICSRFNSESKVNINALVVPQLSGNLPSKSITENMFIDLPKLQWADPKFNKSDRVDMLIGADIFNQILLENVQRNICGSLIAQETIFGWIITGPVPTIPPVSSFSTTIAFSEADNLEKLLKRFWEVEDMPKTTIKSASDEFCEKLYSKTTKRNEDGRYVVSLPFKEPRSDHILGQSRAIAYGQFIRNESRLMKHFDQKATYDSVLSEYLKLGHMERVTAPTQQKRLTHYYFPHHAVIKPESTTTKIRVVFNASCPTSSGLSLNDILHTGPALQNDIIILLLRWRLFRYVFSADIEKMYRQIVVNPADTCYQRILFRSNPSAEVEDFELKTVTFGVNAAPYLAIRTLLQLAEDCRDSFPIASEIIKTSIESKHSLWQHFLLNARRSTGHSIQQALTLQDRLICLALSEGGVKLQRDTYVFLCVSQQKPYIWKPPHPCPPAPFWLPSKDSSPDEVAPSAFTPIMAPTSTLQMSFMFQYPSTSQMQRIFIHGRKRTTESCQEV
ncbi:uncharacterized protein [Musca autumnalis]|uniref:uncharacterized protein n=1 Tax=Musca autumnalis TaxID=221902 RepID=UPI003CF49AFC